MDKWESVFRSGIAPQLSTAGLTALADALRSDDRHLVQGISVVPPMHWPSPVVGACPACYGAWKAAGTMDREELETWLLKTRDVCGKVMGEPNAIRHFTNAVDLWTRDEMRDNLLPVVEDVLKARAS